jgi:hypothetical protein
MNANRINKALSGVAFCFGLRTLAAIAARTINNNTRVDPRSFAAEELLLSTLFLVFVLLTGCSGGPATGPVEVHWDRDACERCRMVLSDRYHSAQVREPLAEGRSRVHRFDDIGCAILWLEDKPWRDDPAAEFWVTDYASGEWIDGRTATYLEGQVTPMEFGLGARPDPVPGGLTLEQARLHVLGIEKRFNVHGVHLEQAAGHRHHGKPGNED